MFPSITYLAEREYLILKYLKGAYTLADLYKMPAVKIEWLLGKVQKDIDEEVKEKGQMVEELMKMLKVRV